MATCTDFAKVTLPAYERTFDFHPCVLELIFSTILAKKCFLFLFKLIKREKENNRWKIVVSRSKIRE